MGASPPRLGEVRRAHVIDVIVVIITTTAIIIIITIIVSITIILLLLLIIIPTRFATRRAHHLRGGLRTPGHAVGRGDALAPAVQGERHPGGRRKHKETVKP